MTAENETVPAGEELLALSSGPRLVLAPSVEDEESGALWIHRDYTQVVKPWENESHIGPVHILERFGDIESFVEYIHGFFDNDSHSLITWSQSRLLAVLDYHESADVPGRCQWVIEHPFELSREWKAWTELCSGPKAQQVAVDKLEDLADGIVEPAAAELMTIVQGLRANVKREAVSEFLPTGDVKVSFTGESRVRSAGDESVTVPSEIRIGIPVLKGHVTAKLDGAGEPVVPLKLVPVIYELTVKVRTSVDEHNLVVLRFSMPNAEKVLEEVIAERVQAAKDALGDAFTVYRAAD